VKAPNLNRGRCIRVFDNFNEIIKFLNEMRKGNVNQYENIKEEGNKNEDIKEKIQEKEQKINNKAKDSKNMKINCNNQDDKGKEKGDYQSNIIILQKYIEKPFLYNGRKFDIRIWVLFTYMLKTNRFDAYVFKEGHLKACCDNYDINSEDLFIHLTNYSVQKHNKNFSKSEIGNEISFADFQKELNKTGKNIDFKKKIFPEIIQIVQISANSVKGKINLSKRSNCFEIFGYDFILDINFKPYLLEINTNPGYEESSPLIKMLVPRMIDDAMKLTIDKEFETMYKSSEQNISNFFVDGYSSEENMWLKIKTIL